MDEGMAMTRYAHYGIDNLLEFHEVSNIFPEMSPDEFTNLKDDIVSNGLLEPIWLHDDKIIDGRHRYKACLELNIQPKFRTWHGNGSLVSFVVALNLNRRHLTVSQRAVLALPIKEHLQIEIAEIKRQEAIAREAAKRNGEKSDEQTSFVEFDKTGQPNNAREQAAKTAGVGNNSVAIADEIKKKWPHILPHVTSGLLTLNAAKKLGKLPAEHHAEMLNLLVAEEVKTVKAAHRKVKDRIAAEKMEETTIATVDDCHIITGDALKMSVSDFDTYGVIIADPPWEYRDKKDGDPKMGGYTYNSLTEEQLRSMPVEYLAKPDCVLLLWGTWPKLPEAINLITAWGFTYTTGFPWVKMTKDGSKPVYRTGHWVAGCSEVVLLAKKGSPKISSMDNYLGLLSPSFEHSKKPDSVHLIAEALTGPYLELFARRKRPGWTVFGNEIEE